MSETHHQAVGHWECEGEGILARQVFVFDEQPPTLRSGESITFPAPPLAAIDGPRPE